MSILKKNKGGTMLPDFKFILLILIKNIPYIGIKL